MPAVAGCTEKFARAQNSVDMARIACALERYRLANGQLPDTLNALTPGFIAKLPHDVINGQALKYRRTADGQFVLYSVGWNETDDGGNVELTKSGSPDNKKGDWVWRYPTKA
jgi:type II secretory pathway pseudopilin PulG